MILPRFLSRNGECHCRRRYLYVDKRRLAAPRRYELASGDRIYYAGDCRHGVANPGTEDCVYHLANNHGAPNGRGGR